MGASRPVSGHGRARAAARVADEVNGRPDCGDGHARARKAETSSPPRRSARAKLLVTAEDRGFEPRRVLPPNRISSAFPLVTGPSGNHRDHPESQASRAGNAGIVPGPAGNAERVRTRNGHTPGPDAGHRGSCSMAAMVPAMRSIMVRAMPASRWTSLLRRPASIAAWTDSSGNRQNQRLRACRIWFACSSGDSLPARLPDCLFSAPRYISALTTAGSPPAGVLVALAGFGHAG